MCDARLRKASMSAILNHCNFYSTNRMEVAAVCIFSAVVPNYIFTVWVPMADNIYSIYRYRQELCANSFADSG